jgi:hypothetical protein
MKFMKQTVTYTWMDLERNEATGLLKVRVYCETLKRLHRAIQNKRSGMLISGLCYSSTAGAF